MEAQYCSIKMNMRFSSIGLLFQTNIDKTRNGKSSGYKVVFIGTTDEQMGKTKSKQERWLTLRSQEGWLSPSGQDAKC